MIWGLYLLGTLVLALGLFLWWASRPSLSRAQQRQGRIIHLSTVAAASPGDVYTVLTYNMGYASGLSNNLCVRESQSFFQQNLEQIARTLQRHQADIVALQEVDIRAHRSYWQDQAAFLAQQAGYPYRALVFNWDKRYVPFPYWPPRVHFKKILAAQVVLARHPITEQDNLFLRKPPKPFYYRALYIERVAQNVILQLGSQKLRVINMHLEAFHPATREQQARDFCQYYAQLEELPTIILGDFNTIAPQVERRQYPGVCYPNDQTLAILLSIPGMHASIADQTGHFTFPADQPNRRLDYILGNQAITWVSSAVDEEAGTAADHLPVVARLKIHPTP